MLSVEATQIYLIVQSLIIIINKKCQENLKQMNIVHITIERESEKSQAIISIGKNLS